MQSRRTAALRFAAVPVSAIAPGYPLELPPEFANADASSLIVLAIVRLPSDGPATANLLAPVVIDGAMGLGVQAVRSDSRFSAFHPLGSAPCW